MMNQIYFLSFLGLILDLHDCVAKLLAVMPDDGNAFFCSAIDPRYEEELLPHISMRMAG